MIREELISSDKICKQNKAIIELIGKYPLEEFLHVVHASLRIRSLSSCASEAKQCVKTDACALVRHPRSSFANEREWLVGSPVHLQ